MSSDPTPSSERLQATPRVYPAPESPESGSLPPEIVVRIFKVLKQIGNLFVDLTSFLNSYILANRVKAEWVSFGAKAIAITLIAWQLFGTIGLGAAVLALIAYKIDTTLQI